MSQLLVLPVLLPLVTAAACLLAWGRPRVQRVMSLVGALLLVCVALLLLEQVRRAGVMSLQVGDWPAPFGITFVADLLSAIMVSLAALMGVAVAIYSLADIDSQREAFGYHPLVQILLMGVCGAFLTGDIFNLYVWFEVMLMASFVLLGLGGERAQMEGAVKYVTLNLLSSAVFLAAVGILYGLAGSLNMADLAVKLRSGAEPGLLTSVSMLFLVAFGIKAAAFPFFFWLPASYHTPPVAVSALFAGLLTKVGVYAIIRVFTLLFVQEIAYTHEILLVVSGLTMVTGVLGAMAQKEIRRVLSFHIVSQIGYMLMGLSLLTPLALAGSIFYIVHHIIVKTNLFLVSGICRRHMGTEELARMGGLASSRAGLAVLFLIPAFSLAGVPPLSGFFAKLALVRAGLEAGRYTIVFVALAVSLLTLLSMTKIWSEAFWKPDPRSEGVTPVSGDGITALMAPAIALASLTVAIGFGAAPLFDLALEAARQLLDPSEYIRVVLGEQL